MAEGIVYLDVDDEITSAASRIRNAPGTKVALVVPYGSRIATSRMNFRLLSREAVVSNRRLSIVSGDAAARSLAASAGLPVFGTVPEYEAAIARPVADTSAVDAAAGTAEAALPPGPGTDVALGLGAVAADAGAATAAAGAAAVGLAASETVAAVGRAGAEAAPGPAPAAAPASAATGRKSQRPRRPVPDASTASLPTANIAPAEPAGSIWATTGRTIARPDSTADADLVRQAGGRTRAPLIAAIGLAALALVVLAVGAYLFLPSATIAITPRRDAVGPVELTVSADPDATDVDVAHSVVPAIRLDVPVEAAETFTTTGTHVEESAARGSVTFTNYDTSSGTSIPSGSIVSTEAGLRFRTQQTVVLQPAGIIPFQPRSDSVPITAVKTGEGGNVPANTIRVVPQGQNPDLLRVNNPDPTSGGTHTETPEIKKPEVDKALAALQVKLDQAFADAVAAGASAPAGTTVFPGTKILGPVTPVPDPKTLVGQATATFDLKLSASGTVIAVDPRPVQDIARAQLGAQVAKDHRLIADSVVIDVGEGTVGEDGQVTFQATARAVQVANVDPDALRALVKGKTAAEAEAALAPFGSGTVSLWPDWVSTVPSNDSRLTITVNDAALGGTGPGSSSAPSGSPPQSGGSAGSPLAPPGSAAASGEPGAASAAASSAP